MSDESRTVTVEILGKDYEVSCAPDEVKALKRSAEYLDEKMREIKDNSRIIGLDRIAVMAALNISNDFIRQTARTEQIASRRGADLKQISGRLDEALVKLKSSSGD
jgi:cell division protein ZapA